MMNKMTDKAKEVAKGLLEKQEVDVVIGWEQGTFEDKTAPLFMKKPEDVERLVINDYIVNSPAPYLLHYKNHEGKIAIFVKGCDSRGIVRLIQDKQFARDKFYLIGVPCSGMKEVNEKGEVVDSPKCSGCVRPNPVICDTVIGEEVQPKNPENRFKALEDDANKTVEEKWNFWNKEFGKCIRCYACQRACPACNCKSCIFIDQSQEWIERRVDETENASYSIIKAYHMAGRCVECGECERACPAGVPIMKLNKRVAKDIEDLFGSYEAGVDLEQNSPLGDFKYEDPEEFL
jgi:ferredoxin